MSKHKKILIIIAILVVAGISGTIEVFVPFWGIPNILICVTCGAAISLILRCR